MIVMVVLLNCERLRLYASPIWMNTVAFGQEVNDEQDELIPVSISTKWSMTNWSNFLVTKSERIVYRGLSVPTSFRCVRNLGLARICFFNKGGSLKMLSFFFFL